MLSLNFPNHPLRPVSCKVIEKILANILANRFEQIGLADAEDVFAAPVHPEGRHDFRF
jgi:hypothetical protein